MPENKKQKLLLHVCCAACSIHVAKMLKEEYEVTLYFNNPQIFPATEYAKRLIETKKDPERFRPVDTKTMKCDYSKAEEVLDWRPKIEIEDSLRQLLGYWRKKL